MNVQIKQKIHSTLSAHSVSSETRADGLVTYAIHKVVNGRNHTVTVDVPGEFHHNHDADGVAAHVASIAGTRFEQVRLNPELTKGDPVVQPTHEGNGAVVAQVKTA